MSINGEEQTEIIILVDEDGNEHNFAMVDRFQVDMNEYAVLVPALYIEDDEDGDEVDFEDEAYIFRIDLEEGEETLVEVEDEIEWNEVAAIWEERLQSLDYADDDEL
ncbi:MAG: DUF1292 domain-containing protein [Bacillota bacterium]|nr:DUF1292 domain-containing protein [Bacillota bacterium]MDW7728794.1 DUF1292 domain-containing protein [Bacillota bacterium]